MRYICKLLLNTLYGNFGRNLMHKNQIIPKTSMMYELPDDNLKELFDKKKYKSPIVS
jgi:hypothetical protein